MPCHWFPNSHPTNRRHSTKKSTKDGDRAGSILLQDLLRVDICDRYIDICELASQTSRLCGLRKVVVPQIHFYLISAPEIKWISFDWQAIFNPLPGLHFSQTFLFYTALSMFMSMSRSLFAIDWWLFAKVSQIYFIFSIAQKPPHPCLQVHWNERRLSSKRLYWSDSANTTHLKKNKLASLEATLVRKYDSLTDRGKV